MAYVRIIDWDCNDCVGAVGRVCQRSRLNAEIARIPDDLIHRECSHGKRGVQMDVIESYMPAVDEFQPAGPDIFRAPVDPGNQEAPDGWLNLDATKDIGYAAREEGRYGSHPSHDRFDDDSNP